MTLIKLTSEVPLTPRGVLNNKKTIPITVQRDKPPTTIEPKVSTKKKAPLAPALVKQSV